MEYSIRKLSETDLDNPESYFSTLSHLRSVGLISSKHAKEILAAIHKQNGIIFIAVDESETIIGSITIFIEQKFIHEGGCVGHIEDVVTRQGFEGNGISSALMKEAIKTAKEQNCYKVILDAAEDLTSFYERFGFRKKELQFRLDL